MAGVKPFLAHWRDALRDSNLDTTATLAGYVISTYSNSRGLAFPGKTSIANGIRARSTRTADGAVNRLEQAGFLTVERSPGGRPNRYHLTVPTPQDGAGLTPQDGAGFKHADPAIGGGEPRNWTTSTPHGAAPESGSKAKAKAKDTKDTPKRNSWTVEQVRKNVADLQEMVTSRFQLPPRVAKELHTEIVDALYALPLTTVEADAAELIEPLKALHALRQSAGKSGFDGRQGERPA